MCARRVAELIAQNFHHLFPYLRQGSCGGVIVKVDFPAQYYPTSTELIIHYFRYVYAGVFCMKPGILIRIRLSNNLG